MNLTTARRPEHLWLLTGALLLLALLAWAALFTLSVHGSAASRLAEVEPRHARIAGLLQNNEQIAQSDQALKANLTEYVYPSEEDPGQIGNLALQKVRDIASGHGLRVASSQVAVPRENKGFDRIGLSLRVEGDWPQLQSLLRDLARQRPVIYSDTVQIGSQGGYAPGRPITVSAQFELYVLKERRP